MDFLEDLTSIGKHKSPLSANKSPLPSIPEPAALTTRNGLSMTCIARALAIASQDLVTASTPFGIPARTARSSLSYWLATIENRCQVLLMISLFTRQVEA